MSYYPCKNRREYCEYDEYDCCEHDYYDCYENDEYCECDYHGYEYDCYDKCRKYNGYKKQGGYHKFNKCSCFEEMKRLLECLEGKDVKITTKSGGIRCIKIQCVCDGLVNGFVDDSGTGCTGSPGNSVIPIEQICSVSGTAVSCACLRCRTCKRYRRKECCCSENELRCFLNRQRGVPFRVFVEGQTTEVVPHWVVSCVTEHLAIFTNQAIYTAVPLCCITEIND